GALSPGPAVLVALAVGAAAAAAWVRWPPASKLLALLGVGVVLFPYMFLTSDPIERVVLGSGLASYPKVRSQTPVVVLILDELPTTTLLDDRLDIDAKRFPNFARLARSSTWYRRATTVADSTTYAVPAILTGCFPSGKRYPVLAEYPCNLFTLLGGSYRLVSQESLTRMCPDRSGHTGEGFVERVTSLLGEVGLVSLRVLLPRDWLEDVPQVAETWQDFLPQDERPRGRRAFRSKARVFLDFVEEVEDPDRPTLFFLHSLLPHIPYVYLPDGRAYAAGDGKELPGMPAYELWGPEDFLVAQGYQRHMLQSLFVDRLLGKLLDRLEATGLYDRCLLVVVADHGVSFRPNDGRRLVTDRNMNDLMPVPLFIKEPGQREGRVDDAPAQVIDVLPTIADSLGIPLNWKMDGQSLRRPLTRTSLRIYDDSNRPRETPANSPLLEKGLLYKSQRFPPGKGFYSLQARPDLVGRLPQGAPLRARFEHPERFRVGAGQEFLPCWVRGTVEGRPPAVAVAVNGVIRATVPTFLTPDGKRRFSAMVPPEAFGEGDNRVEAYECP
ncbi:MAG: sulfatase-like hydrolase/transferase, partial [Candidatus Eremiobacterota bacterium]